jgi:hypothetical protein
MKTARNAIELEMLIQLYYSAEPIDHTRSVAHGEAARRLVDSGVADETPQGLAITEAGTFFVQHLLVIPYPKTKVSYFIPGAGE